jgi:hypothetical protein
VLLAAAEVGHVGGEERVPPRQHPRRVRHAAGGQRQLVRLGLAEGRARELREVRVELGEAGGEHVAAGAHVEQAADQGSLLEQLVKPLQPVAGA